MTQKRKVGPGGGDFALNPNRFDYSGGGGGLLKGASVVKKDRRKKQRKTAKPESSMKTKKKATRTKAQMSRLLRKLKKKEREKLNRSRTGDSEMAITGEQKGGLTKEISFLKKNLVKQDKSDRKIVNAYKRLQKHKYGKEDNFRNNRFFKAVIKSKVGTLEPKLVIKQEFRTPEFRPSSRYTSSSEVNQLLLKMNKKRLKEQKDPAIRKVIRKNKKLVKEKFKEQIKKDRAKRKLAESKKRRVRNK